MRRAVAASPAIGVPSAAVRGADDDWQHSAEFYRGEISHSMISVLITSRNRPHMLRRCVQSILTQTVNVPVEVLIFDDQSDPPYSLADLPSPTNGVEIRLMRGEKQRGVSGARNDLMKASKGEVMVILDDDAIFETPSSLQHCWDLVQTSPDVGVIAFRVQDHTPRGIREFVPFSPFRIRRDPDVLVRRGRVAYFMGCGHAIRRRVFEKTGGYRDDLVFFGEELDLAFKATTLGFTIVFEPTVRVAHMPQASVVSSRGARDEWFYRARNMMYLAWRHVPALLVIPFVFSRLAYYAAGAARDASLPSLLRGVAAGFRWPKAVERRALSMSEFWGLMRAGLRVLW